jgi:hypothetical protein
MLDNFQEWKEVTEAQRNLHDEQFYNCNSSADTG